MTLKKVGKLFIKLFGYKVWLLRLFPSLKFLFITHYMRNGSLNKAIQLSDNFQPKKHEKDIVDRISSMSDISNQGLKIKRETKTAPSSFKILFLVHNSLPYDKAGYAIRTHSIVKQLREKNIDVVVATRAGYPWDLQKHRDKMFAPFDLIDGVKYVRLYDDRKTFKKGADSNYIDAYAKELVREAKTNHSTIIHAHSNYLNAHAAIQASNEMKIPSIYELRGLWHFTRLTVDENYRYNGMFDYEQKMVEGAALGADRVVTISQALKDLVVSWGIDARQVVVIPNAVDMTLFQPMHQDTSLVEKFNLEQRVVVGFVGSLTAYEGLELLIGAIDSLIDEGLKISLVVVGDGKEMKRFKTLSRSKYISFVGRVPHEEVKNYYSIFDICAYPRNNHEVCRYVPPLKPLEAMAMKKAVIVSDVAPLLEMVEDGVTGLVCKADNQDSLKEKLVELYKSKELRELLTNNAYVWVKKERNWNVVVEKYESLYNFFLVIHDDVKS